MTKDKSLMKPIIDVHTHIFPDFLAEKAIASLSENSKPYFPHTDGTAHGLLTSMKENGITASFVANIATKPEQARPILDWSLTVRSEKIIPLGSIYPASKTWKTEIDEIKKSNLPGIKLHALYQNFNLDDKSLYPIYNYIVNNNLFLLIHAGYDIAFPTAVNALPVRVSKVIKDFPDLKLIVAHLGGWRDWENAYKYLIGENVYLETSFIHEVESDLQLKIIQNHNPNLILFGTDSPWLSQKEQIAAINKIDISNDIKEKIFYKNAINLLKSVNYITG
jgi:uncharacterized protein